MGHHLNELTRYRYQVVLHFDCPEERSTSDVPTLHWRRDGLSPTRLRRRLIEDQPHELLVLDVPNARLDKPRALLEALRDPEGPQTAAELHRLVDSAPESAATPDELRDLAQGLPYDVDLRWHHPGDDGTFTLYLRHTDLPPAAPLAFPHAAFDAERPLVAWANRPLRGRFARRVVPELREDLAQRLPEHMVPRAFLVLDELPLTPNGKLDFAALPTPEIDTTTTDDEGHVAPRTAEEKTLAKLFAEVLGRDTVGVGEDFFALGGHSLLATRIVAEIRRLLDVELELRALFEAPTVAALALKLAGAVRARRIPPLERQHHEGTAPLSFAQQRLWFLDSLTPGSAAYNFPLLWDLEGPLDEHRLRRALTGLLQRHEVLRTSYPALHGEPYQVIHEAADFSMPTIDLSEFGEEATRIAQNLVDADAARPFDLAQGPVLRALLLRLGDQHHTLALTLHHIATDGWSVALIERDFRALYDGQSLPELPVQYAHFARWQRDWLQGEVLEEELAWWRERLAQAKDESTELPTDFPRPTLQRFRGRQINLPFPEELTTALDAFARRRGATLFMATLAAMATLLHRLTGESGITLGSPIAGRNHAHIENLVGFFVNTLALRLEVDRQQSFGELLDQAVETTLGAQDHQDIPFEKLVDHLGIERDLARNPLFQILFAVQNLPGTGEPVHSENEDLRLIPRSSQTTFTRFDLEIHLWQHGPSLAAAVVFDTDLFEATSIRRLLGTYQHLLSAALRRPESPMGELPLLDAPQRHQLLIEANDTAAPFPEEPGLATLARRAVTGREEAIAAVFGEGHLSHGELHRRARRLAYILRSHGVRRGDTVGLHMERELPMLWSLLAALEAGAAYLPLNPEDPAERLRLLVEDAQPRVVLSQEPETLRDLVATVLPTTVTAGPAPEPLDLATGSDLAYVIYTSGSTGKPKGVLVEQRSVTRLVIGSRFVPYGPDQTLGQCTTSTFDVATAEIWGTLLHGARLVGVSRDELLDGSRLAATLTRQRIQTLFLTTAICHRIAFEDPQVLGNLEHLVFAGEAADPGALGILHQALDTRLVNAYGPTECTTFATWRAIDHHDVQRHRLPIGGALANTEVQVLDRDLRSLPLGAVGELCLGGPGLARGYLARPAITAQTFVPHPSPTQPGDRLYRTGDLVRHRSDGELDFLGRIDHQVKIRGFRIEPGEVENVLAGQDAVGGAAVTVHEDPHLGLQLVAWVQPATPGDDPTGTLLTFLEDTLPRHLVPAHLILLDELPLNTSGKVDRKALSQRELESDGRPEGTAPRDPREEILFGIWADVLGQENISVDDDFFRLGGHSLLATQVVSRVERAFGVEVPLRTLFEAPTVERLARHLDNALATTERPPLLPNPELDEAPLSSAQERLWFLSTLAPESPFYNIPLSWTLRGPLDEAALTAALGEIVRRHATLRTRFPVQGASARAVVEPFEPLTLPRFDLRHLPRSTAQEAAKGLAERFGLRPFDLAQGPLLRVALVLVAAEDGAPEERMLLFNVHHIVFDGWSIGVLLEELQTLYEGFLQGRPATLPALPVQYTDFARWQRRWLTGETLEHQVDWWRQQLANAEILRLPTDHARPPVPQFHGGHMAYRFPRGQEETLSTLAQTRGATLSIVLTAATAFLLGRWAGQDDVVIGTPIAGRTQPELEPLIGFFVNSLALRFPLGGDPNFATVVDRGRETALGAYSHQDLPFEQLVEELHPERDLSRNPIFQVMCNLQNLPGTTAQDPALRLEAQSAEMHSTHFDLELHFWLGPEGLTCKFSWDRDLFDDTTLNRFARRLETLFERATQSPEIPLSRLDLFAQGERHQVLHELSDAATPWPQEAGLFDLFEHHALANPDAPAVLDGRVDEAEVRTTYGTLYRQANALAHRLHGLGVGDEALVAVLLDRGLDLAWIFPGILAADGAYLPLDTAHPTGRLRAMLQDAGAQVLLTTPDADPTLLETVSHVLYLDELQGQSTEAPPPRTPEAGEHLAYVMYTSGSTGRPKGVAVVQRAISRLVQGANYVHIQPEDRIAQVSNASFDAATFEFWGALTTGAALVHVPTDVLLTPQLLGRTLEERGVTVLSLTMGPFHKAAEEAPEIFAQLKALLFGAEAADAARVDAVRRAMAAGRGGRLVHLYGPTESTSFATWQQVAEAPDPGRSLPIGRPLTNTTVRLLDPHLEPVPLGSLGSLYLGGPGLARAYWQRPALTATAFVPDPHGGPGERLYTTGDLARRMADGTLQFLGRADQQVKVRGFRLEPGEVEAVLEEHDAVARAVVLTYPFQAPKEDRQLAAWLVRDESYEDHGGDEGAEQIQQWQLLFDDAYEGDPGGAEPTFNIVGWNSMVDGEPIPADTMRAWLEDTARGILRLEPKRLLEIGCGTGLVLFRVAPHVEHYAATDISRRGLDFIHTVRQGLDDPLAHAELHLAGAHELHKLPPGTFDTVVLNSVVQYFPSAEYLAEVLQGLMPRISTGGQIFLGDVRSLPLSELLHTQIVLAQAADADPASTLRRRVAGALLEEDELLLHPHFFHALARRLPRTTRVEIVPKDEPRGGELGSYRYQVVLHLDSESWPAAQAISWRREGLTWTDLRQRLRTTEGSLALEGVPNSRLHHALRLHDALRDPDGPATAAALRAHLEAIPLEGIEPADLMEVAAELGFRCAITWERPGKDGAFDALLWPAGQERPEVVPTPAPQDLDGPLHRWANRPTRGRFARRVLPQVRTYLEERLPDYMVPRSFSLLEELPLTPNGKLDRGALPEPELGRGETRDPSDLLAPRNATEERLAQIWERVLDRDRVGVDEDFFDLGGHSLLATQVVSQVAEAFNVEMPLRVLFENTTIAELATWFAGRVAVPAGSAEPPLRRLERRPGRRFPVSFSQLREWILESLQPGTTLYHIAAPNRLRGPLDAQALENALRILVARHEALRTAIVPGEDGGEPYQVIHPPPEQASVRIDLRDLPEKARNRAAREILHLDLNRPFDLGGGLLMRSLLVQLEPEESLWLLTIHHIIADGWSIGLFNDELYRLYEVLTAGRPVHEAGLPELPLQYADFAAWQRGRLTDDVLDRLVSHWRERIEGSPPFLPLPLDRPRPAVRSHDAHRFYANLPKELVARAEAFASERQASSYMVLLTAFKLLLFRLTGHRDLTVGTYIANRNRSHAAKIFGFFTNTLALRTQLELQQNAGHNLARVKDVTLDAYAHQDLPFEKLLDSLEVERSTAHSPIFQVMLTLHNLPGEGEARTLGDLESVFVGSSQSQADFDLEIGLYPWGDSELIAEVKYGTRLFDRTTVDRWIRAWRNLLADLLEHPQAPLDELSGLTPAQRHQLVVETQGPPMGPTDPGGIHRAFAVQARATPAAIALEGAGQDPVTYGDLLEQVQRLAHRLRCQGVGVSAGTVVALAVQPGPGLVVALLAVLEAGGTYLPLDLDQPTDRLAFVLQNAKAHCLLTSADEERHQALVEQVELPVLLFEDELKASLSEPAEPLGAAHPEQLAYILYTSGTTGEPKGVGVPHRAVLDFLHTADAAYGLHPGDRILQFAALTFDTSVEEIMPALCRGATVVYGEGPRVKAPVDFLRQAEALQLTVLDLPTAYWHVLLANPAFQLPPTLRLVILGGEKAQADALTAWKKKADPTVRLYNSYGPSEATVVTLGCDLAGPHALTVAPHQDPPLGFALPNVSALVLDAGLHPVPRGAAGELHLGGPGLARGYLGRPALTAQRFVPDPTADDYLTPSGARLYKTGDRTRLRSDGALEFLGRVDDQVKLRGLRVEPGEVAAVLTRHASVEESEVLLRKLPSGQQGLVAYAATAGSTEEAELRAFLRSALPEYMVPAAFVLLPELPKTTSGKVDRRALLALPLTTVEPNVTAPTSAFEGQIAAVWAEVLGLERVGIDDNFFDLGGDSLLLLNLHRLLEERLERSLKVLDLFQHTTVRALARHLGGGEEKPRHDKARDLVAKRKAARKRRKPRRR